MKALEVRKIYEGKHLAYYEIDYLNLAGKIKTYEMVSKNKNMTIETIGDFPAAVVMLVFNEKHDKILLTNEYRLGVNRFVINTPAGLIDKGETPEAAARRELWEETGLRMKKVISILPPSYTCPSVTDDLTYLIVCEAEGEFAESTSPDEEIRPKWYSKEEVKKLLSSASMAARTQGICLMWAEI